MPVALAGTSGTSGGTEGIGVALADSFRLHSLPGSTYSIYLDFDGQVTTGSRWNDYWGQPTILSPAFSLDGSDGFSDAERGAIQQIWQQVAEYFSPFNIDVTTEDPGLDALTYGGPGDTSHGIRVVITEEAGKSFGGLTFNGSFSSAVDTPAFIYAAALGNSLRNIVVAAVHEVGHALGLDHDGQGGSQYYYGHGTGNSAWSPIMGVGYGAKVLQWSEGDYYAASNTQDDLAIITTANNGVTWRADDAGDDIAHATALGSSIGTSGVARVQQYGVISGSGSQNDVDVYAFTVAQGGGVNLTVTPWSEAWVSGSATPVFTALPFSMLDVKLTLYDAAATVIAGFDDNTRQDGSISAFGLDAGTYYLAIDGTGWGTPMARFTAGWTEYGSLGQYMISGSYTALPPPDTTPPAPPAIARVGDNVGPHTGALLPGEATNDPRPTLSGTAEANNTIAIHDGAALLGTVLADATGAWRYTTPRLAEGAHSLTATASDAAGNESAASAAFALVVDTTAPAAPEITGPVGEGETPFGAIPQPGISGLAEPGSTVAIYDGGLLLGTTLADALGTWAFADAALSGSGYRFTAAATDAAGNTSPLSPTFVAPLLVLDHGAVTTTEAGRVAHVLVQAQHLIDPPAGITVTVAGLDPEEGALSATTLLLNAANNWSATLDITGLDDRARDGNQAYQLSFAAPGFDGAVLQVTNRDDEIAATAISRIGSGAIDPAAFLAADGQASTLRERLVDGSYTVTERWKFASLAAGDYVVHVKASATEAMRLLASVDDGATWQAVRDGGKAIGPVTSWDGDYLVGGVTDSLVLRITDGHGATADTHRDSLTVDLMTIAPAADLHPIA